MMRFHAKHMIPLAAILSCGSCSIIEKSSRHGFESGYYFLKRDKQEKEKAYVEITDEYVKAYPVTGSLVNKETAITIRIADTDSLYRYPMAFTKQSLDIDITTIPFKYRFSYHELPVQLTTDFNAAIYAGWRHDNYRIRGKTNPLGQSKYKIISRGYDFGVFTGPGTAAVNPFSTLNSITSEYNGMIIQLGLACFLESNIASFGIAAGLDYLLSKDRHVWMYDKKNWIGFIIGIALN